MPKKKVQQKEVIDDDLAAAISMSLQKCSSSSSSSSSSNPFTIPDDEDLVDDVKALESAEAPDYSVSIAPSGRARCQKCDQMISKDVLRVGVKTNTIRFGIQERFSHLFCTVFHNSVKVAATLNGFGSLEEVILSREKYMKCIVIRVVIS